MHWASGRGRVPKTWDDQERRARLRIIPPLGQLPLRSITAADLRAYVAALGMTVASVDSSATSCPSSPPFGGGRR
ncbi:hypothetical protein ACFYM2_14715 [Streptomyces sp. NPDC006711]|uniref:hypothetical protein n=1 Tax=Streptomyces sp. NPDC006711 TaxID=3364762 RepID=UPI00369F211F